MTPRLPTELCAQILTFACEDQPILARREIRSRFRLVCHDWYGSVDRWKEVILVELNEVRGAVAKLELTRHCPTLQHLKLEHVGLELDGHPSKDLIIDPRSHLTRLTLSTVRWSEHTDQLLPPVFGPSKLQALTWLDQRLYRTGRTFSDNFGARLLPCKDSLTELRLLDPVANRATLPRAPSSRLARTIERFSLLRKLEISPVALPHLYHTLAPLQELEDLSIIQGHALTRTPPSAAQLHAILDGLAPLRRVAISASLVDAWSAEEQDDVADAAARKGIAFVKL